MHTMGKSSSQCLSSSYYPRTRESGARGEKGDHRKVGPLKLGDLAL